MLKLRSAAEVAPQISATAGPDGQPAIQLIGPMAADWAVHWAGTAQGLPLLASLNSPVLTLNTPAFSASNYVLRGRMRCEGAVGDAHFDLCSSDQDESCAIPGWRFSGTSDWQDFELTVLHVLDGFAGVPEAAPAEKARSLRITAVLPGAGKVMVAGPFVIAPVVLSDGKFEAKDPIVTLPNSAIAIGARAATAQGPAGEPALEVAAGDAPRQITLALSQNPAISSPDFALRGRVKYDNAATGTSLELFSDFGGNRISISREKLSGTSGWRDFELRVHAKPGMRLERLNLDVGLPGAGTVTVAEPLVIAPMNSSGAWWTERQAGLIGGGLGGFIGALGGLIGLSAAWGKSRRLTVSLLGIGLAVGGVSMVAGMLALLVGQPWYVCYPMLLIGTISFCALGGNLPQILRRFQNDEFRRMTGLDAV
jgi:hypothetical protein